MNADSTSTGVRAWPPLSAAVLAGGASRRMGADKALLSLAPGDAPVIVRVLRAVGRVSDDIFVVAPDRTGYQSFGVPIVPDRQPALGPIGGIATALAVSRHDHCLVVACDLPLLDPGLLSWMAGLPRDYEALIPSAPAGAAPGAAPILQPLHAIYACASLPTILARIAAGDLRLTNLANWLRLRTIDPDDLRSIDPAFRSFLNLNSPSDVRRAAKLLAFRPAIVAADGMGMPTERPKNG